MKFDFFSKKKFKCDVCDEKFKTQTELAHHNKLGSMDITAIDTFIMASLGSMDITAIDTFIMASLGSMDITAIDTFIMASLGSMGITAIDTSIMVTFVA